VIVGALEVCRCAPDEPLGIQRGVNRRRVIARKASCLQFANPIVELGKPQIGFARQLAFGIELAISLVIEQPENRVQTAQRSYQPQLRAARGVHKTHLGLAGKGHAGLGLLLHLCERVSGPPT